MRHQPSLIHLHTVVQMVGQGFVSCQDAGVKDCWDNTYTYDACCPPVAKLSSSGAWVGEITHIYAACLPIS